MSAVVCPENSYDHIRKIFIYSCLYFNSYVKSIISGNTAAIGFRYEMRRGIEIFSYQTHNVDSFVLNDSALTKLPWAFRDASPALCLCSTPKSSDTVNIYHEDRYIYIHIHIMMFTLSSLDILMLSVWLNKGFIPPSSHLCVYLCVRYEFTVFMFLLMPKLPYVYHADLRDVLPLLFEPKIKISANTFTQTVRINLRTIQIVYKALHILSSCCIAQSSTTDGAHNLMR